MGSRIYGLVLAGLVLLGVFRSPAWAIETAAPASSLDTIIAEALDANPDLQAATARADLFASKVPSAASLEDPRLSLAIANYPVDTFAWDQTPMTGEVIRLTQNIPFPGKLAARGKIAEQQALWYRETSLEARLQLIRQAKDAWYGLYFQDRALERTEAGISLLGDIISLAENRYETGRGQQQDILRAQVERSILLERKLTLKQQRETLQANINTLRNMPTHMPVLPPTEMAEGQIGYTLEEIQEMVEQRPLARAYQALAGQYAEQGRLARLDFRPDFFVGAAYTIRQESRSDPGTDFASLELGMTLPIYRSKRHGAVAEANAASSMAIRQMEEFRNRALLNIHEAWSQLEKSRELMHLYKDVIIPQAAHALEASISGYQVGRVGFSSLLDNMLNLYRYEVEYFRALADTNRSLARLEAEAGLSAGR